MLRRFAAVLLALSLAVALLSGVSFAASGDPDIGCYEYGASGTGVSNKHPTYPASNFGGDGPDYYVSTTGSDTDGDGTKDNPWLTLAHAAANVSERGAVINMAAGTYDESDKTIVAPGVSIEGAGDGSTSGEPVTTILTTAISRLAPGLEPWYVPNAIIDLVSETNTNGNQHISGIRFVGDYEDEGDGSDANAGAALEIRNRNNVRVSNCTFTGFALSAVGWRSTQINADTGAGTYATGGSFDNNIVTNCAGRNQTQGYYFGALFCGGLEGFYIYKNRMIEGQRDEGKPYMGGQAENGVPIKFWYYDGWIVNCKLYDNYLEKSWIPRHPTDAWGWPFAIEAINEVGLEIYENTIIGTVDTNRGSRTVNGKKYDYSIYIHDNLIGPTNYTVNKPYDGICLEDWVEGVLIERNTIRNCCPAIWAHSSVNNDITDLTIRYNLCTGIRTERDDWYQDGIGFASANSTANTISNLSIYNNTLIGVVNTYGDQPANAIDLEIGNSTNSEYHGENIVIANNIISGFGDWWNSDMPVIDASGYRSLDLTITNNLFWNNGVNAGRGGTSPLVAADPAAGYSASNYEYSGNVEASPQFVSATNYRLSAGSPAIDAGKSVAEGTVYDLDGKKVVRVAAAVYGAELKPDNILFTAVKSGYGAQTPKSVTVSNTGNTATGELTISLSGENADSFTISKTAISGISAGGKDSFTVVPNTGLAAGTYTATITINGENGISDSVVVSFTVNEPAVSDPPDPAEPDVYGIALDPSGDMIFAQAKTGYGAQIPISVTVRNTGNTATGELTISLSGENADSFSLSKTVITGISSGGTDSFTVAPNTALAAGTYTATVTVEGANGISESFAVSVAVSEPTDNDDDDENDDNNEKDDDGPYMVPLVDVIIWFSVLILVVGIIIFVVYLLKRRRK